MRQRVGMARRLYCQVCRCMRFHQAAQGTGVHGCCLRWLIDRRSFDHIQCSLQFALDLCRAYAAPHLRILREGFPTEAIRDVPKYASLSGRDLSGDNTEWKDVSLLVKERHAV